MTSPAASNRPRPTFAVPSEVFTAPGPVVSVYLTTEAALPQATARVELRWKTMRTRLADDGAPETALAAVDPLIEGSHAAGETLVALAGPGGLLYTTHLPEPPEGDIASVAPLPHVVPLLAATQALLPHVVVATDRLGAELIAVLPDKQDLYSEVAGEELHVTRSAPGGWSQRRFQQRAENRWEANAREVADALTRLVDTTKPRLVIVSGDVRAVQFLRKQLPTRAAELLTEVQGDYSSLDEALRRSMEVVATTVAHDTAELLEDYRREQQHPEGLAVGGSDATLAALHAAQVDTVLLDPIQAAGHTAWFGPNLAQVAGTADALRSAGVPDPQPAPLADTAVRAATATAAAVRIMPADTPELAPSGIGALLRYR